MRLLKPALATLLIVGGILLLLIPGPGIPVIIIGAGLLADRSRRIAHMLDWLECRVRKLAHQGRQRWCSASRTEKQAVLAAAALVIGAAAYGGFRFVVFN